MDAQIAEVIYAQVGLVGLLLLAIVVAFWKLHSELTTLRVEMAHELGRDLLSKRYTAYAELWSRMQPTAMYTTSALGPSETIAFSETLSDWYFSVNGGLFLTRRARDFYFPLQGLLQSVGRVPGWRCDQRPHKPEQMFIDLLKNLAKGDPNIEATSRLVREPEKLDPILWRRTCEALSTKLVSLAKASDANAGEAIYVSIQQVSSILRTNLTHDIRSRFEMEWPIK